MAIISQIETVNGATVTTGDIGGQHYVAVTKGGLDVYFHNCESEEGAWRHYLLTLKRARGGAWSQV